MSALEAPPRPIQGSAAQTLEEVAGHYTRGTLALCAASSLAAGFFCGLFLVDLLGSRDDWVASAVSLFLVGKWPSMAACFFVLLRMSVLAPYASPVGTRSPWSAVAYAVGTCWVAALGWAVALLAASSSFSFGLWVMHPDRAADTLQAVMTQFQLEEIARGCLRAILVGLALGWLVEAESRVEHAWQGDVGTRSMQLMVLGLVLITVVEAADAYLFWLSGVRP